MISEVIAILSRSRRTMVKDATGVCALFVILFVGLHMSGAA